MTRTLRALFLDIDDTLYSTSEFAAAARRAAMDAMIRHGLHLRLDEAMAELQEVISEFGSNYPFHYDRLLRRLPASALPEVNPAILVAAAVGAYHDTKYRSLFPFRDVPDVLQRIRRGSDLTIGVITEGLEIKQAEKLVRLGVVPYLTPKAIFISDQIGISKPNRKLYQRACNEVGVRPDEAMYVGDHPESDIAPAKALGMVAVRHRWQGGKHANIEGSVPADYEIRSFHELLQILRDDFGHADL
ncbi:MAG: TIGR02253 family HAD-type hydrolase [Planctomycetes bacterium]|nr:TIGR02253 family HAD-type hydrolase [Planctomycetota bacterium]